MMKNKLSDREIKVIRLLELIEQSERVIEMARKAGRESSLKGSIYEKNKLVKQLKSLLKEEYNFNLPLEDAA